MSYTEGDVITSMATFTAAIAVTDGNSTGLVDPTAVYWVYQWDGSDPVTLTYGIDEEITRVSLGVYRARLATAGLSGTLSEWWEPRGVGEATSRRLRHLVLPAPQPG